MSRAAAGRKRMLKQTLPPPTQPTSNVLSNSLSYAFKGGKGKEKKGKGQEERVERERKEEPKERSDLDAYLDLNASTSGLSHQSSSGSGSASHSLPGSQLGSEYVSVTRPGPGSGSGSGSSSGGGGAGGGGGGGGEGGTASNSGTGSDQFIFPTSRSKARPRPGPSPTPVGAKLRIKKRKSDGSKSKNDRTSLDAEPNEIGPLASAKPIPPQLRVITTSSPSTLDTNSDRSGSGSAYSSVFPISPVSPRSLSSTSASGSALPTTFGSRSHYSHASDVSSTTTSSTHPVSIHSIHSESASSLFLGPSSEPTSSILSDNNRPTTAIPASTITPGATPTRPQTQSRSAPLSPPVSPPASTSSYSSPASRSSQAHHVSKSTSTSTSTSTSKSSSTSPQSTSAQASTTTPFVFPTSRSRGHPKGPPLPLKLREAREERLRKAGNRVKRSGSLSETGSMSANSGGDDSISPTSSLRRPFGSTGSMPQAGTTSTRWMGIPLNSLTLTGSVVAKRKTKEKGKGKEKGNEKTTSRLHPSAILENDEVMVLDPNNNDLGLLSPASPVSPSSRLGAGVYPQNSSLSSTALASSNARARSKDSRFSRTTYFTHLSNGTRLSHSTLGPEDSYSQIESEKDKDDKYAYAYEVDEEDESGENRYSFSRPPDRLGRQPRRRVFDLQGEEDYDYDSQGEGEEWDDADSYVIYGDGDGEGWEDDVHARYHSRAYTFRSYSTEEEGHAVLERGLARARERERLLKMKEREKRGRSRSSGSSGRKSGSVEGYKEYGDPNDVSRGLGELNEWDAFDYNYEEEEKQGAREDVEHPQGRRRRRGRQQWGTGVYPFNVRDETLLDSDYHTHNLLQRLIQHTLSAVPSPLSATPSPHSPSTPSPSTPVSENPPTSLPPPTPSSKTSSSSSSRSSTPAGSLPLPNTLHPNRSLSTLSSTTTFHPTPSIVLGPPLPSPSFHNYGLQPPASVLDLGCGLRGLWVREAVKAWGGFGTRVVGMDLDVEEPGLQKMTREETSDNMDADQTPRSRSSDRPSSSGLAETTKGGKDVKASRSLPAIRTSNGQVNENEGDTDSPLRLVRGVIQGLNDVVDGTTDKSRLLGVDVEASSVDSHRNIEFVKGNFLTAPLPFPSSSFDLVRIANLTYAIPYDKWDSLLREISRVLTAGGRLEVVDDHVFFAHARNPNPGGEHGTHKRQRPVSGSGTVMSSETDGDNGSFYFRHSLTPSQYSAFSLSGPESGSTSDPPSHSSPTQATATAVSSTLASTARPSDPDSSDKSHNYQRYLEALYHHRNLNQAWKNHQMTSQSLESLFEHLMNMKYGIHLCPSEFLEETISRGLGYATELGTWHFVLMKPSPLRVETEVEGDLDESESAGTLVGERKEKRGRNKKKDDGPSPAAAIASDFRSRTMAALIANLGLPEEDKQNGGGSSEDESDEDDNDSEEDILKTSPGLMLWPRKILPMSQDELEASVLKHATVLLACGRQLGRYAGTLEVMKYRFEREEYKERMRKESEETGEPVDDDFDLDPEEERQLEHDLMARVESEVKGALEEYQSFLHGRFNPPRPLPPASEWKPIAQASSSATLHVNKSTETLHDENWHSRTRSLSPVPSQSSLLTVQATEDAIEPSLSTPNSATFSHHSRNASGATMSSVSSDARSAIWDYQSELQDHISWSSADTDEEIPDTPRAHIRILEVEENARTPSPRIRSPSIHSRVHSHHHSSRSPSRSSGSQTRAPSLRNPGDDKHAEDEPTLVRTFHVYEGIKLDGSVLAIGTAI